MSKVEFRLQSAVGQDSVYTGWVGTAASSTKYPEALCVRQYHLSQSESV